jgi:hypothetical protein
MLEDNTEHFNFIENLTRTLMVDNLIRINVQYVIDCQKVLAKLHQKGVTNLDSQQQGS